LTASSDLSLRIYSSITGVNPRTLQGHTRGITCTYILGVGKQVLSGSRDGTIRLWDVGAGKEVRKWTMKGKEPLVGIFVLGEETKVVVGVTKKRIEAFEFARIGRVFWSEESGWEAGIVSMAYDPAARLLATGHADGVISVKYLEIDTASIAPSEARTPSAISTPAMSAENHASDLSSIPTAVKSVTRLRRNDSPIYSLQFAPSLSAPNAPDIIIDVLVGTGAGLPCRLELRSDGKGEGKVEIKVKEEFAGWEAVGVESWAVSGDSVWCAGGEGGIRRYQ
jgi:proteasomal ATPase-associated factor 1